MREIEPYIEQFTHLNRDPGSYWGEATKYKAPHKPILLLAVLDLVARGDIISPFIGVTGDLEELNEQFNLYWQRINPLGQTSSIAFPFARLHNEPFWELIPQPGKSISPDIISFTSSISYLRSYALCARLNEALFQIMQKKDGREALRDALLQSCFSAVSQVLLRKSPQRGSDSWVRSKGHNYSEKNDALKSDAHPIENHKKIALPINGGIMTVPEVILTRDRNNAVTAKRRSHEKLRASYPQIFVDDITGALTDINKILISQFNWDHKSLVAVRETPFHAMVEVEVTTKSGKTFTRVWYGHENTKTMQMLGDVVVLPWTHPGIQKALVGDLGEEQEIEDQNFTLVEVTPLVRARFDQLIPELVGMYDPYGRVGQLSVKKPQTGLKAVKFQMTKDQVRAFASKMKGVLFVTGAPGSGKTTVAFQRMRFLFDAGDQQTNVVHSPDQSRVFLANSNLIEHSKLLLEKQLEIPSTIISLVSTFVDEYLDDAWRYNDSALFLTHPIKNNLVRRGREAFFSTCSVDDLKGCWKTYDIKIVEKLLDVNSAEWTHLSFTTSLHNDLLEKLQAKIEDFATRQQSRNPSPEPSSSEVRMDHLYAKCAREYENLRTELERRDVDKFDRLFLKWLFYVYDPLDAIETYFGSKRHEGALRIKKGTASRVNEEEVIDQIFSDFSERQYRREELAWLAWLLRFALPTATDPKNRFREVPNAESPIAYKYGPWSHVVIDEAQDLSVVEASLISSFVVRDGALTISADFMQVVSPVHGMVNPNAFKIGCRLISRDDDFKQFPFTKNMRQSSQIGNFLRGFYVKAFGELAPFIANDEITGPKPQLRLMSYVNFAPTIKNALNTFKKANFTGSIALLQINEDEDEMARYREMLALEQIPLAPLWAANDVGGGLVTTSVERIKGLEYDVCFILGLEEAENTMINFSKNRVYVALSRPTQRLYLLCEHFPSLLHGVTNELYDYFDAR